ncbi:MAG TPA: VWA domain-containing protein [Bryobacteraceae bacterium]|nr:VWA domain-containing protein [Bryobacteraceae bacterium]
MRNWSSLLALMLAASAAAQDPLNISTQPALTMGGDKYRFTANARLVVLPVSVTAPGGKLITDLPQQAFGVFENGIRQRITVFEQEDVPVSMGVLIDNSGSMFQKLEDAQSAAATVVRASNPHDEVFIVNFSEQSSVDTQFTSDIERMEAGLAHIDSRGNTALRDAISNSIDYLVNKGKKDKKLLLVITDGEDNHSSITLEQLVNKARQTETLIYAIGLLSVHERLEAKKAQRGLEQLTTASGGIAYYPRGEKQVTQMSLRVAHEVRNQYTIGYSPGIPSLDGSFRKIEVVVNGVGANTRVRTRSGYYAMPDAHLGPHPSSGGFNN